MIEMRSAECVFCKETFEIEASNKRVTCSKSCASRLLRQQYAERNTKQCEKCSEFFPAQIPTQIYCCRTIEAKCKNCAKSFSAKCRAKPSKFCSASCRNTYMRKHSYSIPKRICVICDKEYSPTVSKQTVCLSEHFLKCQFCGEQFSAKPMQLKLKDRGKYCDNICSTLGQMDSKLDRTLISQYKNPNQWALEFKKEHKRKPSFNDWTAFFDTSVPAGVDEKFFLKKNRLSGWETKVLQYIERNFPGLSIENRVRILDTGSRFKKEIDLYIPELRLGFEVQDFLTHSRDREDEPIEILHWVKNLKFKHGPKYHSEKHVAARKLGISLHEVWQDEIEDGSFKGNVSKIIGEAIKTHKESR